MGISDESLMTRISSASPVFDRCEQDGLATADKFVPSKPIR
jgi:hypothetical protein